MHQSTQPGNVIELFGELLDLMEAQLVHRTNRNVEIQKLCHQALRNNYAALTDIDNLLCGAQYQQNQLDGHALERMR